MLVDGYGMDFIMFMVKWCGYGGEINYWGCLLEFMIMMVGFVEVI